MLNSLLDVDEDPCVENVAIGASTIIVYLQALKQFCGHAIKVDEENATFEGRTLYEVVLNTTEEVERQSKPVIVIEAGQEAGSGPVMLALFIIEQIVACEEYSEMMDKVTWVILPCTNPDGQEYLRCGQEPWHKNRKPLQNKLTYGVDISRNFDDSWTTCPVSDNIFSSNYPGPSAASENETQFISNVLAKYKQDLKAYVSIRRDGHSILYPFASKAVTRTDLEKAQSTAGEIAGKINQRAGNIQWFLNSSIFDMNGEARCGHSVDYAYNKLGIPYSYEMRVFPDSTTRIMSKFQTFPKGYETSLRNGYFSGIRELYNIVVNEKAR
ncbi:zinc carboxypeptidase A 1-like [Pieris napi]|uniref:zinc carboxypeptidase A 1-like n=1 Tax=Pieris napi TaxID=78633 RepID=UPI001FBBCBB5|nr:zinc carboxypeptidase A 1-like [Pieris napi]